MSVYDQESQVELESWTLTYEPLPKTVRLEKVRALLPTCAWSCGECSRCQAYEELRAAERTVTLWGMRT